MFSCVEDENSVRLKIQNFSLSTIGKQGEISKRLRLAQLRFISFFDHVITKNTPDLR